MFSFHKPKVYRSSTGCCICKAKSSSSRFTDSKKYENDFLDCFKLETPRQGEICNACVLLVKRWKKLPVGSERNWQHVVDARAGPGMKSMKSMTKFKSKKKFAAGSSKIMDMEAEVKKEEFQREFSPALSDKSDGDVELAEVDDLSEEGGPSGDSSTASPGASDCEEPVEKIVKEVRRNRRHKGPVKRWDGTRKLGGFIDLNYWREEKICCGTIYRGQNNEMLVDPSCMKPCPARISVCKRRRAAAMEKMDLTTEATSSPPPTSGAVVSKLFSDSSSDSGYDDSSNQGASPEANGYKKEQVSIEDTSQIPQSN